MNEVYGGIAQWSTADAPTFQVTTSNSTNPATYASAASLLAQPK
jgi:hypothetical protein